MSEQASGAGASPDRSLKLLIELGPLLAFFLVYSRAGIYWATGVLMVATVLSLVASWTLLGRLLAMPVVTAVLVVVFGGLTFWLDDPRFIKIKPTIINLAVCRRAARRADDAAGRCSRCCSARPST